jgi:hypothetical protein
MTSVTSFSAKISCSRDEAWYQLSSNASHAAKSMSNADVWGGNGTKLEKLGEDAIKQIKAPNQLLKELARDPVMSASRFDRSYEAVNDFRGSLLKSLRNPLEFDVLDPTGGAIGKNLKDLVPSGCEIKR